MGVYDAGGAIQYPSWIQARNKGGSFYNLLLNPLGGNVGIGTASPGFKLQVAGEVGSIGTNAGFRVFSGSGDNVNAAPWYGIGQSNLVLPGGSGVGAVQLGGYYGLNFQTSGGQMVLNESGNVGIGTASQGKNLM